MRITTDMQFTEGLIIKGVAGFYYVKSGDEVYRCKARGIFKQQNMKPAVGDTVRVEIIPDNDDSLITEIFPRKNSFIRPFVANVDCFAVVAAAASPAPILSVIDKFLVMAEKSGTDIVLCVNKCDLIRDGKSAVKKKAAENIEILESTYSPMYPVIFMGENGEGTEKLKEAISGKKTALSGPSGVGKSTILNRLIPSAGAETGNISLKSGRGKHTTRHSELFTIDEKEGTMVFDTPGFTSFDIMEADEDELQYFYPDIARFAGGCRYGNCRHISEPGCSVRKALEEGRISMSRYESYRNQLEGIADSKKY